MKKKQIVGIGVFIEALVIWLSEGFAGEPFRKRKQMNDTIKTKIRVI